MTGTFHVRVTDEVLSHAINILGDNGIIDNLGLTLDFLRDLFAECNFLLDGVEVYAFADIAFTNRVGILLFIFFFFFSDFSVFSVLSAFSVRLCSLSLAAKALDRRYDQHERRHQAEMCG